MAESKKAMQGDEYRDSLEKVARFIAEYRTDVAKRSIHTIGAIIDCYSFDPLFCADEINALSEARNKMAAVAADEDARYECLVTEDVLAQLLAIRGVKSVGVSIDEAGEKLLTIMIQAYYLHNGYVYDAGLWEWMVPTVGRATAGYTLYPGTYTTEDVLEDGTPCLIEADFLEGIFTDSTGAKKSHPFYGGWSGFCFGSMDAEIKNYLLTGDFVSAFQLISLCLHHINPSDKCLIVQYFERVDDMDICDIARYFGLNTKETELVSAMRNTLECLNDTED